MVGYKDRKKNVRCKRKITFKMWGANSNLSLYVWSLSRNDLVISLAWVKLSCVSLLQFSFSRNLNDGRFFFLLLLNLTTPVILLRRFGSASYFFDFCTETKIINNRNPSLKSKKHLIISYTDISYMLEKLNHVSELTDDNIGEQV